MVHTYVSVPRAGISRPSSVVMGKPSVMAWELLEFRVTCSGGAGVRDGRRP